MLKRFLKCGRGQAAVEFALVIPVLLLLLFGIVEFGRIFGASLIVAHSAREGARLGSMGASDSEIILRVEEAAASLDADLLDIEITPDEAGRETGTPIRVHVAYPVTVYAPFISIITGQTVTVQSDMVMRVE
ncbi:MAG: pilus assembly protein [Peptococcaceae bacterium]|jgi:Flp pilus assembly protein TadG|nr:pilus assembly protein [Peptococcaceae bacterium]MDH7524798.1 pilus assembly protein [Peptococcaceae bacterium]